MNNIIRFQERDETLTLYVEKEYEDGWLVGWCPERNQPFVVHPDNVVREQVTS